MGADLLRLVVPNFASNASESSRRLRGVEWRLSAWSGRREKSKDPDVKPTSGAPGGCTIEQASVLGNYAGMAY